jgi:predicted transcriptional regulator
METQDEFHSTTILRLVVDTVSAYVANNHLDPYDLPDLIKSVHGSIDDIYLSERGSTAGTLSPCMPIEQTIKEDYLVSLEDGRHYKSMKRHLARCGLTPEQYREKWRLPTNYPMVAPSYAKKRAELARSSGLGRRKPGPDTPTAVATRTEPERRQHPEPAPTQARRRQVATAAG